MTDSRLTARLPVSNLSAIVSTLSGSTNVAAHAQS